MIHAVKNRLLPLILIAVSTAADQVPARKHVQIAEQLIVNRTPINPVTGQPLQNIILSNQEKITLKNGDTWTGRFLGYEPRLGYLWSHPNIRPSTLAINAQDLQQLTLAPRKAANTMIHPTTLTLTNGDHIFGRLAQLDRKTLALDTSYAGRITLQCAAITAISPGIGTERVIYEGPDNEASWILTNNSNKRLTVSNRVIRSSGIYGSMAGRNFDLSDRCRVEFDLKWVGSSPDLYLNLYTDKLNQYTACNAYSIRIRNTYARLYRCRLNNGSSRRESLNPSYSYRTNGSAFSASLLIDKPKRKITLLINGVKVGTWTDTLPAFAGQGRGLMFYFKTSNAQEVHNLRITQWDGQLPTGRADRGTVKQDTIHMVNGDVFTGRLLRIQNNQTIFKTAFAELNIPMNKVNLMQLASPAHTAPLAASTLRFHLRPRGRITAYLTKWQEGKVHLNSTAFGKAIFDEAIIGAIEHPPPPAKPLPTKTSQGLPIDPNTGLPIPVTFPKGQNLLP